jgi:hypothetical protein
MEVSGQIHSPAALLPGKNLGTDWIGGWVGPTAGRNGFGKEKISYRYRNSNPGPSNPKPVVIT